MHLRPQVIFSVTITFTNPSFNPTLDNVDGDDLSSRTPSVTPTDASEEVLKEGETDQEELGAFFTVSLFTSNLVKLQNGSRALGALLYMVFLRPKSLLNVRKVASIISSSALPASAKVKGKVSVVI
jgi:hypothetical protein